MALFYSILQTGSGTLGNQYLRKTRTASGKEVNVLATKNFTPKNPRTYGQMVQRAKFATAVKFYQKAVANFFAFAYEDKKANESWFNAFMRHNINAAIPMNKYMNESPVYPAIGNRWLLTQGQLQNIVVNWDTATPSHMYFLRGADLSPISDGDNVHVGELSDVLIQQGVAEKGDIFTLVTVASSVPLAGFSVITADEVKAIAESVNAQPRWFISQFIIDPDDTTELAKTKYRGQGNYLGNLTVTRDEDDDPSELGISYRSLGNNVAAAAAIIITRKKDSGLLCSSSYLIGNAMYDKVVAALMAESEYQGMLASWGADLDTAILKGDIAGDGTYSTATPAISTVNGSAVPVNLGNVTMGSDVTLTLGGTNFGSEKELTENSFTVTGGSVKSFKIDSTTSATLVITISSSAVSNGSVAYDGKTIATFATGDKA